MISNAVFVLLFTFLSLNACQDSGSGRKPVIKAANGRVEKPIGSPTVSVIPSATPIAGSNKPTVNFINPVESSTIEIEEYSTERIEPSNVEIETLIKVFEALNHNFQDAWSITIQRPKQKPFNILGFVETKLKDKSLIRKEEDKKQVCGSKLVPYLYKKKIPSMRVRLDFI